MATAKSVVRNITRAGYPVSALVSPRTAEAIRPAYPHSLPDDKPRRYPYRSKQRNESSPVPFCPFQQPAAVPALLTEGEEPEPDDRGPAEINLETGSVRWPRLEKRLEAERRRQIR
jgi:hypothetical protein